MKVGLRRVFSSRLPLAVFSWRYFWLQKNEAIKLHKEVCLAAYPNQKRLVWFLALVYNLVLWIGFRGWLMLFRVWRKFSPVLKEQTGISRTKQFCQLLRLTFGLTTPSSFYYSYKLYKYPFKEWFNFIYTHELPSWHQYMSPKVSSKTRYLLTNKEAFANEMLSLGVSAIQGKTILKDCILKEEQVFTKHDLFFKPVCGSQKRDAYKLGYYKKEDDYELVVGEEDVLQNKREILKFLQSLVNKEDYLVQPFLQNHDSLAPFADYKTLATIRVISCCNAAEVNVVSALLELPTHKLTNQVFPLAVDVNSGLVKPIQQSVFEFKDSLVEKAKQLEGQEIFAWQELVQMAKKAHLAMPDVFSIGWDFSITTNGVKLIEGNFNWGVASHQLNKPILMPDFLKERNKS